MAERAIADTQESVPTTTAHKVRIVTATSLFDGHDAAINIMRRILQSTGAEVIHLGHNRSVGEIVKAAVEEDAQAVAISSYQGGHMEFFTYLHDLLKEQGASHVGIYGGGGGVIVPDEMDQLHAYGIGRIYSPEDGRRLGLQGMINDILRRSDFSTVERAGVADLEDLTPDKPLNLARLITMIEEDRLSAADQDRLRQAAAAREASKGRIPVIGVTGTGGAGKSSLTDELVRRFLTFPDLRIGVVSADPTKRKTGGALLGDRIRMNSIALTPRVFMRSMATRSQGGELPGYIDLTTAALKAAGFDFIIVETSGIGQGDTSVVDHSDLSLYVMTAEYGAQSQLEKIDMIDYADCIAINKFDHQGSLDALRDVRKQYRRSRQLFDTSVDPDESLPIFGTICAQFNDLGVNALFGDLRRRVETLAGRLFGSTPYHATPGVVHGVRHPVIPGERSRYLSDIADSLRTYHRKGEEAARRARKVQQLDAVLADELSADDPARAALAEKRSRYWRTLDPATRSFLETWPKVKAGYEGEQYVYHVRGKAITVPTTCQSLAHTAIPRVKLPDWDDWGELTRYFFKENLPGAFPYTAGVFPFRRTWEDPKRQFAGEGPAERTNRRFHYLTKGDRSKRLSTAFDSVTLYGEDPDLRPDIFGKIGESGVSICSLEDMQKLYDGFDLCDENTSVSMTINGPAPIMLAFFMNTAFEQQKERFRQQEGREPRPEEDAALWKQVFTQVRGTVQADILQEDQAQNTCIFSTEFALRMMGDIQDFFIRHGVRNYYSVSISGYHIAEAGANPITQLALTLANGFTYAEYYLSRGMAIDDFAPNFSFFFSNGLDPEYTVIGRVARRIWAVALRDRYGAAERSQKLKYHIQTSGRSLHAQEMQFNDIRTTLQGLLALWDNCNSLHTNAYDEAVTTPTEESVRRAMAIQLIINKELGLTMNENPWQGSHIVEWLTDVVEAEVLKIFDQLTERGGVLGAMEKQFQRSKIQEESLYYEHLKHSGAFPIIGVNTFLASNAFDPDYRPTASALTRTTPEEKQGQYDRLRRFQEERSATAPEALRRLQEVALSGGNIFEELLTTVRHASLGQISRALYEAGGQYRRNM